MHEGKLLMTLWRQGLSLDERKYERKVGWALSKGGRTRRKVEVSGKVPRISAAVSARRGKRIVEGRVLVQL
jgi:vancomycin resistance protein YoaR